MKRFADKGSADIFEAINSKDARKSLPTTLHLRARMMLVVLTNAVTVNDLRIPASNRPEQLKGDRQGQLSIRINDRYRICFIWTSEGAFEIGIVDYH